MSTEEVQQSVVSATEPTQTQQQETAEQLIPTQENTAEQVPTSTPTTTTTTTTTAAPTQEIEQAGEQQQQQQPEVPEITPALASEGGREVSHKILYVGGLSKAITDEDIREIFSISGTVQSVKILFDKNRPGFNYAFVEFDEEEGARGAFESLNGKIINGSEFRINWAYQSQQAKSNPEAFNVFVGDLSSEINDEKLKSAFANFTSLLQAHVMWDMQSGRSRGYGFVSFEDRNDADEAIRTMNGEIISGRAIRLNWASHKQTQPHGNNNSNNHHHHGNHHHNGHHNHHHNNNGNGNLNHNGYHYNNNKYNNGNNNNNNSNNNSHHQQYNNGINTDINTNPGNNNNFNNGSNTSNVNGYQQNNFLNNGVTGANNASVIGGVNGGGLPLNNGGSLNGGNGSGNGSVVNGGGNGMMSPPNYDAILRKSPNWQTTVYLGNLAHFTTQGDLIPLLQNFGFIVDLKFYPEKGCAFVKYDSHERAALAIVQLTGLIVNGRALKLGWGKERAIPGSVPYQNYPMVYGQ